jgi:hypothetical protein
MLIKEKVPGVKAEASTILEASTIWRLEKTKEVFVMRRRLLSFVVLAVLALFAVPCLGAEEPEIKFEDYTEEGALDTLEKGSYGGYAVLYDTIYGTKRYPRTFVGGDRARIRVDTDGDVIGLYILNSNGRLVDSDTGSSCSVSWEPAWTDTYWIYVRNLDRSVPYVYYRIMTN